MTRQDYGTPRDFIDAVERRFGALVCDLAASAHNAKAPTFYDVTRDSLSVAWELEHPTGNLWLNPPFADIAPWAAKCASASATRRGFIHMLVPASIGSMWFSEHVNGKAFVEGLSPRMTFEGCTDPYPKDLLLATYGYGLSGFGTWRWRS